MSHILLWSPVGRPGAEYCVVTRTSEGWLMRGSVIAVADGGRPLRVEYQITCDGAWRTRSVRIATGSGAAEPRFLRLTVKDGQWQTPTGGRADLQGCVDVDLGITPATNTLPIRRLDLAVGASAEVTAAWVRFPSLEIRPLGQIYTRLDERTYRYESDTGFRAEIVVDEDGFVVTYPDGWERYLPTT